MDVTRPKRLHVTSDLAGDIILRLFARLKWVILAYENFGRNTAPVSLQYLVLQDIDIVIEIVRGKRSGNLDELCGDFGRAKCGHLSVYFIGN